MFVQVIQGQVADREQVHAVLDRWVQELAPGSVGWLGTTAGVTDDGTFVALARFESEEAARRNSDRPEQDQWWATAAKLFTGDVTFLDSRDVFVDVNGEPDGAGFVQIMQGRTSDPARGRELMGQNPDVWAEFRPDIVGSVEVEHGDGAFTMALYFTSEEEARGRTQGAASGAEGPNGRDGCPRRWTDEVLRPQAALAVLPEMR